MTKDEINSLKKGDIVRNIGSGNSYFILVCDNENNFILGIRAIWITNPSEWGKVEQKNV